MTDRLRISRADLAKFLPDHRQIRQFESLLARVDATSPTSIEEVAIAAGTAEARASEVLAQVLDLVEFVEAAPNCPGCDDEGPEALPPTAPARLDQLEDIAAPSPATNDALQFDATTAQWIARAFLAGLKYGAGGADFSYFEADGTLVFNGAATVYQDIDFPIIIRTTGPNIPTLVNLQGNIPAPQWAINDYNPCEVQELIHGWKEGSESQWHVHVVTNGLDATDRWINWEVEWFWGRMGGALSATTTTATECLIPANTPTKTPLVFEISRPTLATAKIGDHVWARLRRIANTTPGRAAPTSNPWCGILQMHVELDTVGSRTITAK